FDDSNPVVGAVTATEKAGFSGNPEGTWSVDSDGRLRASDADGHVLRTIAVPDTSLRALTGLSGTGHAWAVGDGGVVLSSDDGGEHWTQLTRVHDASSVLQAGVQPRRWGPPWYYASLVAVAFFVALGLRRRDEEQAARTEAAPSVEQLLVSDRPIDATLPD